MNTSLTAYSPLETLLLFQSLASYGLDSSVFSRISDLLKKNPHITSAARYDSGRLSPEALKGLVSHLLKDELSSELQNGRPSPSDAQNGLALENSKKRKAPSPSPLTVKEASQNTHLIPKLVAKLYTRYREHVIDGIRQDERTYDALHKELAQIEKGELDEQLKTGELPDGPAPEATGKQPVVRETLSAPHAASLPISAPAAKDSRPPSRLVQVSIESAMNNARGSFSNGKSPETTAPNAPAPPKFQNTSPVPLPNTSNQTPRTHSPQQHATTAANESLRQPSSAQQIPYGVPAQTPQGPTPSPASTNTMAASPVPFPQPVPPSQSVMHAENNTSQPSGQTAGVGPPYLPAAPNHLGHYPHGIPPAVPHSYPPAQQQWGYHPAYTGAQPPHAPHLPQGPGVVPPVHKGGYMLPPFQVNYQEPSRAAQQQQKPAPTQTPARSPAPRVPPATAPGRPAVQTPAQASPLVHDVLRLLATTTPANWKGHRPPPLSLDTTPSSATRWKASYPKYEGPPRRSPTVSPIENAAPSQEFPAPPKSAGRGQGRRRGTSRASDVFPEAESRPGRGGRRPRVNRRASVAGSNQARTRSQSVTSPADVLSPDEESTVEHGVKAEPSTPATIPDERNSPEPSASMSTRLRRRANLQPLPPFGTSKRKRAEHDNSTSDYGDSEEPAAPGPQYVVASRNFSKMSVPVMNDIASHKHASLFTNPVKEKDAEGYTDIIRRPQNLKSIRAAIYAGTKAVNAAVAGENPATPGAGPGVASPGAAAGGSTVVLPISAEITPPRGIVNSAQLERELMRMFANAVMFNTGEDGVVEDAREMFEDVQSAVSNWRSAERTTSTSANAGSSFEAGEAGMGGGGMEEDTPAPAGKRRKA